MARFTMTILSFAVLCAAPGAVAALTATEAFVEEAPQRPYLEEAVWKDVRLLVTVAMGILFAQTVTVKEKGDGAEEGYYAGPKLEMYPYAL
mmetsp:Transcript_127535/g.346092  ORF Transcript_127535/g.346092 Transcript_127535/m.346092 type:complete len:91 (+) Transcript_127535:114-386(+)